MCECTHTHVYICACPLNVHAYTNEYKMCGYHSRRWRCLAAGKTSVWVYVCACVRAHDKGMSQATLIHQVSCVCCLSVSVSVSVLCVSESVRCAYVPQHAHPPTHTTHTSCCAPLHLCRTVGECSHPRIQHMHVRIYICEGCESDV